MNCHETTLNLFCCSTASTSVFRAQRFGVLSGGYALCGSAVCGGYSRGSGAGRLLIGSRDAQNSCAAEAGDSFKSEYRSHSQVQELCWCRHFGHQHTNLTKTAFIFATQQCQPNTWPTGKHEFVDNLHWWRNFQSLGGGHCRCDHVCRARSRSSRFRSKPNDLNVRVLELQSKGPNGDGFVP